MMRRPPDKAGPSTVSGGDVESSNATLNTLFGGARQKSWMTTTGAPVRPTPRRVSKSSLPMVVDQENSSTTAVLPSPAPSAEPSPLLCYNDIPQQSNASRPVATVSSQVSATSGLQSPSEASAQPSPATTSESRGQRASSSRHAALRQTDDVQAHRVTNGRAPVNAQYGEAIQLREQHHAAREQISSPMVNALPSSQRQIQAPFQIPSSRSTQQPTISSLVEPLPANRSETQNFVLQSHDTTNPPSTDTASGNTTFHPITVVDELQPPPRSGGAQSRNQDHPSRPSITTSNIPPRTLPPIIAPLKPTIPTIRAHIASVGGDKNLNHDLEKPRFQLLIDACNTQDQFYVILHQIYCTWSWDQSQLQHITCLPSRTVLAMAFSTLGQLIRQNKGMAPNHLRWFSTFPAPLENLWRTSDGYRQVASDIAEFLSRLAIQWAQYSNRCHARGYPPLVDELVNGLGIFSPILQGVVFTATRRNLGISDIQFHHGGEKIFSDDKRGYEEQSARYRTDQPPTQNEASHRNQAIAARYIALVRLPSQISGGTLLSTITPTNILPSQSFHSSSARQPPSRSSTNMDQARINPPIPRLGQPIRQTDARAIQNSTPSMEVTRHPPTVMNVVSSPNASNQTFLNNVSVAPSTLPASQTAPTATPSLIHPVYGRQEQQSSITSAGDRSFQNQQRRDVQAYATAVQNMTITPVPSSNVATHRSSGAFSLSDYRQQYDAHTMQPQHMQREIQLQIPQNLSTPRNEHLTTGGPASRPRQLRFPSQMQSATSLQASVLNQGASSVTQSRRQTRGQQPGISGNGGTSVSNTQSQDQTALQMFPPTDRLKIQAYNEIHPSMRPFIPPIGYTRPNEAPNPDLTALHQAHVRSPVLTPTYLLNGDSPGPGSKQPRFYQSVKEFALQPSIVPANANISRFTFTLNEAQWSAKARDKAGNSTHRVSRGYERSTLQFRLRCVRSKQNATACTLSDWVVSDTAWPETIFIRVNGEFMEIRRKAHHAKDLPVDITNFVLPVEQGVARENHIKISTPRSNKFPDARDYFVAVEVVEILDHPQIMNMCRQQQIPPTQTLNIIKRSLAGAPIDDDDEITMIVSDLSISLTDPFTARIFNIPARGSSCLHRECFDLETFLETRKSKFDGHPSMVDVWKCPLCGVDARPYALQIDEFFVDVRSKLAADDNLDVKAIWVSADGSWKPKAEAPFKRKAKSRFGDEEDEEGPAAKQRILDDAAASRSASVDAAQACKATGRAVEVIELDDDDDD